VWLANHRSSELILGVIPARGGSKGILKKNIATLAGKPLIQYTFDAALNSRELDLVVLSTDDPEIAEVGRQAGVDVPFLRPSALATDTAATAPVVEHAVAWLQDNRGCRIGAVMVLQPTSPLRKAWHIDGAVAAFREKEPDAVIGVCEVNEHPYDLVSFNEGLMRYAVERPAQAIRRQDFPEFYLINGAIYLVRTSVLLEKHTLLPENSIPCVMDRRYSLDVDSEQDLQIAETLLQRCGLQ
jgi:CMP-N,N'-diacetyllegionaminic acid synthase